MARRFKSVDYDKSLEQTVTLKDVLPPDHLARFVARVILLLDLSLFSTDIRTGTTSISVK